MLIHQDCSTPYSWDGEKQSALFQKRLIAQATIEMQEIPIKLTKS